MPMKIERAGAGCLTSTREWASDWRMPCPLCEKIKTGPFVAENDLAVAIEDAYPVSPGHTLILPQRHESNFFDLRVDEKIAVWHLLAAVRAQRKRERYPSGYNIGISVGAAAGQTILMRMSTSFHVYDGDVPDPRGGIRCVIPSKAAYWES